MPNRWQFPVKNNAIQSVNKAYVVHFKLSLFSFGLTYKWVILQLVYNTVGTMYVPNYISFCIPPRNKKSLHYYGCCILYSLCIWGVLVTYIFKCLHLQQRNAEYEYKSWISRNIYIMNNHVLSWTFDKNLFLRVILLPFFCVLSICIRYL